MAGSVNKCKRLQTGAENQSMMITESSKRMTWCQEKQKWNKDLFLFPCKH